MIGVSYPDCLTLDSHPYFTSDGSPLPLRDIIGTSLFRPHMFPQCSTASHGISVPDSNFPLLSQGDHPVLGTPCWYFHPCETAVAVAELLEAAGDQGKYLSDQGLLRWMEAWFLVLCSVVDIR
jgi:ubiquitin-like-conjugating enzyme ATG10